MNEYIKTKIKEKNTFYQKYIENGRLESDFILLEKLITELNDLIFSTKTLYYENLAKTLNNPLFQKKTYWSIPFVIIKKSRKFHVFWKMINL